MRRLFRSGFAAATKLLTPGLVAVLLGLPASAAAQFAEDESTSSSESVATETTSASVSAEQRGVRNSAIGLGVSAAVFSVGVIVMSSGLAFGDCGDFQASSSETRQECDRKAYAGVALSTIGAVGLITSGIMFGKRKRERDRAQQVSARRIQWDLARSRLVF